MNPSFWTAIDWFGWSCVGLVIIGFALSFTGRLQASLAFIAFGSTGLGIELLLMRLDTPRVVGAALLFLYALAIVIVAAIKERKQP